MGTSKGEALIVDGKRLDGRKFDELRPIKIEAGVLEQADGSAYVEMGGSHVLAAVYGPVEMHPRHKMLPDRVVLQTQYEMAPFSVPDRKRPGPDRRSKEIAKVTKEALESVIYVEDYAQSAIRLHIEILQADAGTRVTGLTAASVALADAGIKMRDMVAACASGKIDDTIVLDLNGIEDNTGQADLPVAYAVGLDEITLLQMDGLMTEDEFEQGLKYAIDGCKTIYELQKDALKRRYKNE
jgi:exosome complex component RRP41